MLILDRVACDFCGCYIGQLFSSLAQAGNLLSELSVPPHFCLCPDCLDSSELLGDE